MSGATLIHRVQEVVAHDPTKRACSFTSNGEEEAALSYAALDRQARAIAVALLSQVSPGQRALLLYPPGIEFLPAFLGCLYAGVIAVPAYPPDPMRLQKTLPRLAQIVEDADISIWLAPQAILSLGGALLGDLPALRDCPSLATDQVDLSGSQHWQMPSLAPDSLAFLQYTSGSTRAPRGVMVSHRNLQVNLSSINRACLHQPGEIFASWLPSYHDMGLVGMLLCPLWLGGTAHQMSPLEFLLAPMRWLDLIEKTRANTSGGPNFAYDLCVRKTTPKQRASLDLSTWRVAFNGAEPIRASTLERFAASFAASGFSARSLFPCYGLAEVTLFASGGPVSDGIVVQSVSRKALAQGRFVPATDTPGEQSVGLVASGQPALPLVDVQIVDPVTKRPCPPHTIGEIWLGGESNAQGYWKRDDNDLMFRAESQKDANKARFLRTGDLGCLYEGQLYVTGRIKDLLIVRGVNIYPQDLEYTAECAHEMIRSGCVAAFAWDGEGEIGMVCEVKPLDDTPPTDVLGAVSRAVLAEHGVQLACVALLGRGDLPKTSSGKLQRRLTGQMLAQGKLDLVAIRRSAHMSGQKAEVGTPQATQDSPDEAGLVTGQAGRSATGVCDANPVVGKEHTVQAQPGDEWLKQLGDILLAQGVTMALARGTTLQDELALDSLGMADLVSAMELVTGRHVALEDAIAQPDIGGLLALFAAAPTTKVEAGAAPGGYAARMLQEIPQLGCIVEEQQERQVRIKGQWVSDFASANYLGLDLHEEVKASIAPALLRWGVHPSWTRAVASPQIYDDLERALATLVEAPEVLVFPTVTLLHMGILPLLVGQEGVLFVDREAHHSIHEAAYLAKGRGAELHFFAHGDLDALEGMLAATAQGRTKIIAVDGIYSMSGAFAPLPALSRLAHKYQAQVYVDDAHGFGVVGRGYQGRPEAPGNGQGLVGYYDLDVVRDRIIYVGGMSKAFSSLAAFVTCVDLPQKQMFSTASSWVFSGPCPVASLASALAGLNVNQREGEALRAKLLTFTLRLVDGARGLGLVVDNCKGFPLVGVVTGGVATTVRACQLLWERQILLTPGLFPAAPLERGLLRFTITARNTEAQVDQLLDALSEIAQVLSLPSSTPRLTEST